MATETPVEAIETKTITAEELLRVLATPAGQQLLASANRLQNQINAPSLKPHSEEEIKKFYKMAEKDDVYYYRVDPTTKKPLAEAKQFVWKIIACFPSLVGAAKVRENRHPSGDVRIQFQLQKCYKNEFTKIAKDAKADPALPLGDGDAIEIRKHWVEMDSEGGLAIAGDRMIDASDFLNQFVREEDES
ncbi:MAG: hypothetical protein KGL39_10130 [Patescibacteria group bacterium]|nr:hypothetical protein [Patescibacteria group bacterium]